MDHEDTSLTCSIRIEWTNAIGIVNKKVQCKNATLRLIRNDSRQIFVEIRYDKAAPIKLLLERLSVHKNFMKEGKATIKFLEIACSVYLTNAPPSQLVNFLRTMFVKMTGNVAKNEKSSSLRTQLLSSKSRQFEEISPVTESELYRAQKLATGKSSTTTPSPIRKRKLSDSSNSKPASAKRLYTSSSPIQNNPLDLEQKEVLEACLSGQNIFFTGSAGTGKSYLLRKIIGALPADVTVATASTGVAACHIGGITLHQFAGIGLGTSSVDKCIEMATKSASSILWKKCKHLIIDEVSMIDAEYFEKVETVARKIRKSDKPFGGIQLILCGDFFQLPPVSKANEKKKINFCFMSKAWKTCIHNTFELKKVHRQEEQEFIDILNEVRIGKVSAESEKVLVSTATQSIEQDGILATRLCSHTQDADLINESKLNALPGDVKVFDALDSNPAMGKTLDNQTTVPRRLELKIGAQVMLLKNINISKGLVNGARGVVKEFKDDYPLIKFRRELYLAVPERWSVKTTSGVAARKQVPLRLAWAFSIHKSQGLTLDCVEMSLGRVFEAGQAYVALSRAQSLKTLRVLDFRATQVWANPDVLDFYNKLKIRQDCMSLVPLGMRNKSNKSKTNNTNTLRGISKSLLNKPLINIS
ncbi:ATP-dependent DNA helicase PIF1 [Coccinella septempunctata]|uniref:ATP-dependent DNA helicase PIF1 n=1 Tax=Coccinella septempunctata TaxID=41139 RepID=UPI001D080159|nr:ATP-dependent DNA helicase PIF1 [Coccinella septempunctata]